MGSGDVNGLKYGVRQWLGEYLNKFVKAKRGGMVK